MNAEELRRQLASASELDRIPTVAGLDPSVDRDAWAAVAEYAYLTGDPDLREAATRYFVHCATLYTQHLSPSFHMVPWDSDQLFEEEEFAAIYGRTSDLTSTFRNMTAERIAAVLREEPQSLVVFRMIGAYSRNQISFLLSDHYGVNLSGDNLRTIERRGIRASAGLLSRWKEACPTLGQLIYVAVAGELSAFREGIETDKFRPLTDKIDTRDGWQSVARIATEGLPYSAILYQRYIGSTFGLATNASTSLKADLLEGPVEKLLRDNRIPFYRVGARERVEGWEQAPDFFIPPAGRNRRS